MANESISPGHLWGGLAAAVVVMTILGYVFAPVVDLSNLPTPNIEVEAPDVIVNVDEQAIIDAIIVALPTGTEPVEQPATDQDKLNEILDEVSTSRNEDRVEQILDDEITAKDIKKALNLEKYDVRDRDDIDRWVWREIDIDRKDVSDCDYTGDVELKIWWDDNEKGDLRRVFSLEFTIEDCELEVLISNDEEDHNLEF